MTQIEHVNGHLPPAPSIGVRDTIAVASNLAVQTVDRIGEAAAVEIEKAAKELECSAADITDRLRELATAIREHSRIAAERVDAFCKQSTDVVSTIRTLQERLEGIDTEPPRR